MADNKIKIGDIQIIGPADGLRYQDAPLDEIFPSPDGVDWRDAKALYPATFGEGDTWRQDYGCYVLRSPSQTILVDTGIGGETSAFAKMIGAEGLLMHKLAGEGIDTKDIDTVFFTHLHPDHVGWNLVERNGALTPRFPQARYVAHRADWDRVTQPSPAAANPIAQFVEQNLRTLESAGVLDILDGERSLNGQVTAIHTPGHTPGHMSLVIASDGQVAMILGDVVAHPVQITYPEVNFIHDIDKGLAQRTRHQIVRRIEEEGMKIGVSHFPEPGFGDVIMLEGRRIFRAL
jgi:glyoxylase-like metal-dependent hydrolase (beta-lactamase superfamily II)